MNTFIRPAISLLCQSGTAFSRMLCQHLSTHHYDIADDLAKSNLIICVEDDDQNRISSLSTQLPTPTDKVILHIVRSDSEILALHDAQRFYYYEPLEHPFPMSFLCYLLPRLCAISLQPTISADSGTYRRLTGIRSEFEPAVLALNHEIRNFSTAIRLGSQALAQSDDRFRPLLELSDTLRTHIDTLNQTFAEVEHG